MSWISRAYERRLCMDLPEANSTTVRDLYCLWVACPCLSWSTVAMCALTWVVFVPRASHRYCALAVALHRRDSGLGISHARKLRSVFMKCLKMRLFKIYGIWLQAYIHTYIHTTSANAVTLVWGSLRLAPNISILSLCMNTKMWSFRTITILCEVWDTAIHIALCLYNYHVYS